MLYEPAKLKSSHLGRLGRHPLHEVADRPGGAVLVPPRDGLDPTQHILDITLSSRPKKQTQFEESQEEQKERNGHETPYHHNIDGVSGRGGHERERKNPGNTRTTPSKLILYIQQYKTYHQYQ